MPNEKPLYKFFKEAPIIIIHRFFLNFLDSLEKAGCYKIVTPHLHTIPYSRESCKPVYCF